MEIAPPLLLLAVITLLTFARTFTADFVSYDDDIAIYRNPAFNPPTWNSFKGWWVEPSNRLWDPMTETVRGMLALFPTHTIDPQTNSYLDSYLFHANNIVLHLLSVLVIFQILRLLRFARWPAFAGGLLYAVHPVQVEPVAWASALKDTLCGIFCVSAIWYFLRANGFSSDDPASALDASPIRVDGWKFAVASVLFVLALLAKPAAAVLPLDVFALALLRWSRPPKQVWLQTGFWLVLAVPILIVTRRAQEVQHYVHISAWLRPLVAGDAISFYLYKVIFPATLTIDYGRRPELILQNGQIYWTWLFAAAFIAAAILLRKRARPIFVGGWIFIASMLPVIGLVEFDFERYSTVADRYLYLPMLGVALAAAYLAQRFGRRAMIPGALILLACCAKSFEQTGYWLDSRSLFNHALAINPESEVSAGNLSIYDDYLGDYQAEIALLNRCIALRPEFGDAHLSLGNVELKLNHFAAAAEAYRKGFDAVLDRRSYANKIAGAVKDNADLHQYDRAVFLAKLDTEFRPNEAQSWANLGYVLSKSGDPASALTALLKAEQLAPANPGVQISVAADLIQLRQYAQAEQHFEKALQQSPGNADALAGLAIVRQHLLNASATQP